MSKIKMRCITCGKWFQSANAKEVTCPDCTQKARKEKQAAKNPPPATLKPGGGQLASAPQRPLAPPKPKQPGGTNQWLDKLEDVKVAQPEPPPSRPRLPSTPVHTNRPGPGGPRTSLSSPGSYRDDRPRGPAAYRTDDMRYPPLGQRPRPQGEFGAERGPHRPWQKEQPNRPAKPRPKAKTRRPPAPPKPKREKVPPPPPFTATPEQVQQVEERYIVLAQPAEFDGIRTQIAQELSIPKKAVKKIIKELRERQNIPSWWELQPYKGDEEELEKIKTAYEPYLPIPPVGVHKTIAEELALKPGTIYQAIKTIRQEMNLPQYNDPSFHEAELAQIAREREEKRAAAAAAAAAKTPETADSQAEPAHMPEDAADQTEPANTPDEASAPASDTTAAPATAHDTTPRSSESELETGAHTDEAAPTTGE